MNDYFNSQMERINLLPDNIRAKYLDNVKMMSEAGVQSENDQKVFYYIISHAPDILFHIIDPAQMRQYLWPKLFVDIFKNLHEYPIDTLLGFYHAVDSAAKKLGLQRVKKAYPEAWSGGIIHNPYDINRWMRATGDIYSRVRAGEDFNKAMAVITANWDKMEQLDYKYWLRFYQEGVNQKYKTAQEYMGFDSNPLEFSSLKARLPTPAKIEEQEEKPKEKEDVNDVRDTIEQQRSRIISRLNAAEKLLASLEGQTFAGDDQETMLMLLQELKRKVQVANKIRVKSSLFEDFIFRTANLLRAHGKNKQAAFFYKIAQVPDMDLGLTPPAPTDVPGQTPNTQETEDAFKKFFAMLETGTLDIDDELKASASDEGAMIVVEAQAVPAPAPVPAPNQITPDAEQIMQKPESALKEEISFDNTIEKALSGVTVQDVVRRLDMLSGLFKRREVARQLALVDLMLDKLGIGSFFPSLGEASRSNLESSQYIATRIEDILSKLRGALETDKTEEMVEDEMKPIGTDAQTPVQKALLERQLKDKERKEKRKEIEEARLSGEGETPEEGVGAQAPAELKAPVQVKTPAQVPVQTPAQAVPR